MNQDRGSSIGDVASSGSNGTRDGPRLLFLACYFPPLNTAACVRTGNIAKYLTRLGWRVTVVTPHPSLWKRVEAADAFTAELEQQGIRRILTGHNWRCLAEEEIHYRDGKIGRLGVALCRKAAASLDIDHGAGWISAAQRACAHLKPGDFDLVLATGSPFSAFRLAHRLARRLQRPYVLDYRDPWLGNPHRARRFWARTVRMETRLLREASAVTVVSPEWASALDLRFGVGAKVHVVTNGFDQEQLARVEPHDFGHFAVVYTGTFYAPKRVITPVMAAMQRLERTSPLPCRDWRFHYYGDDEAHVRASAQEYGVGERVVLHGNVSRGEALSAVRGAGAAVVISTVSVSATLEERGMVPAKLFEAIGLGTPTLLVAPHDGSAAEIVRTAGLGRPFAGSEVAGMSEFLVEAMRGHAPGPLNPEAYAWSSIAARLDAALRAVAASHRPASAALTPPAQIVTGSHSR